MYISYVYAYVYTVIYYISIHLSLSLSLQAMPVRQLQPNAFSYAAVIQAHCVAGDVDFAWRRLREMRQAQLPITAATLRPFLKLGAQRGPMLGREATTGGKHRVEPPGLRCGSLKAGSEVGWLCR